MPIVTTPDHVAIAVPDIDAAAVRWRDGFGGAWLMPAMPSEEAGFASRQLRFHGGAKLELLEPLGPESFAGRFLARFGATIHHVTLKVPDLLPAVEMVRAAGYDVVDISTYGDIWHEGFLRPSQVGGMIVQLAWSGQTDEEWIALSGVEPEEPAPAGAALLGPTLRHPDLDAAARLWTTLGATVTREVSHDGDTSPDADGAADADGTADSDASRDADGAADADGAGDRATALDVAWPSAPLTVRIELGDVAGPVGLRFRGAAPIDAHPTFGPATLSG